MHPFKKYRETHNISRAEAALALGMSDVQLWRIEAGHRKTKPEVAADMEKFTEGEVTAGEILQPYLPEGYKLVRVEDAEVAEC